MLVLALVLVFAVSIALVAIVQMAGASFLTTGNLKVQRGTELNAENAATAAIQNVRVTYSPLVYQVPPNPAQACLPAGASTTMVVYCMGTNAARNSVTTRDVQFFTCPVGTGAATCTSANNPSTYLYAEVLFDDVIPSALPPNNNLCGPTAGTTTSCGLSMSLKAWDVRTADN